MIPQDFESWRRCITSACCIELTKDFAAQRLRIYRQATHPETKLFIKLYGMEHYLRILHWFTLIEESNEY